MRLADESGVPFWPAVSVLDTPSIIFAWRKMKAEAEAKVRPILERKQAERVARHAAASR